MTHTPFAGSRQRVLAADIGGTNSRFALYEYTVSDATATMIASLAPVRRVVFSTQENTSATAMIQKLAAMPGDDGGYFTPGSPRPEHPAFAVLAVPGTVGLADPAALPPEGEVCHCPNIPWPIPHCDVAAALGGMPVRLINDFVAQGFAAALLPELLDAVVAAPGTPRPGFPTAVVGAGTGFGHCAILPGGRATVLGAEAGHCLFPFEGPEECAYAEFLRATRNAAQPVGDTVVSGSGLVSLYAFHTGEMLHTHDAPAKAAEHPVVLEWMARFYGRACRNYILATLALGGMYVTGGLAANLPQVLTHPAFVTELRTHETMGHLLEHLPVWRIRNQHTGMAGAAAYAVLALHAPRA